MEYKELDGNTFKRILQGGALGIRAHIQTINDLNIFPVPDGDTGTNMSRTIESGVAKIAEDDGIAISKVASDFAKGSLLGARGNSGVILSQFFAGLCDALADKVSASATELADAYIAGVNRSYRAVSKPVEGTILTVFRESAEFAKQHLTKDSTIDEFLRLNIEEAERSLMRTKDILPALTEADVVDSGGAGYLCIAKGMYESLHGEGNVTLNLESASISEEINYDLFTTDSVLTYGYCTECLVRLQRTKADPSEFDEKKFADTLESLGCDSIVALRDKDILKVHAHTKTPSDILTLCQQYGEFLNVKIENMSLQHSEKNSKVEKKPHKPYGIVTVATGDGLCALLKELGADVIINGGQTGNPATAQFLDAFASLDADHILVLPNNSNILLTATQAAQLWEGGNVTVIPTKTLPQGYAALSIFNPANPDLESQLDDVRDAMQSVASGEITVAIRDSVVHGVPVSEGDYIGILDGELVTTRSAPIDAICSLLEHVPDLDQRELITLFVGVNVSEDACARVVETLEEQFEDFVIETRIGGQEIYDYLIAVE